MKKEVEAAWGAVHGAVPAPWVVGQASVRVRAPKPGYRPELDGIRGLAILLVLASHNEFPGLSNASYVGVTLFFVLSGYLITGLLVAEHERTGRISLRGFYERRVRRLLPALIAVLGFTAALAWVTGRFAEYPTQAAVALLYGGNVAISMGMDMGYLTHTWSLALEEQFYLVWPVIFLLLRRRTLPVLVLAVIASIVVRHLVGINYPTTQFRPDVRADAILLGCILAFVPLRSARWLGFLGCIVIGLAAVSRNWDGATVLTVGALGSVAVVASPLRLFSGGLLVRMGQISYGLYLWHYSVSFIAVEFLPPSPVRWVVVIGAAFVLALISERYFETPFRLGQSSGAMRRSPVGAPLDADPRGVTL